MNLTDELEQVFSYGTLQNEDVQIANFGRRLVGEPDSLTGYRQTKVAIRNLGVLTNSGERYHLNVEFTGDDSDSVAGTRFEVTRTELEKADVYEDTADYKRLSVQLKSGNQAWVYAFVDPRNKDSRS